MIRMLDLIYIAGLGHELETIMWMVIAPNEEGAAVSARQTIITNIQWQVDSRSFGRLADPSKIDTPFTIGIALEIRYPLLPST